MVKRQLPMASSSEAGEVVSWSGQGGRVGTNWDGEWAARELHGHSGEC